MKKILSLVLALLLLFTTSTGLAVGVSSPKEEVVYGMLNLDGSVDKLYVVNIFNKGSITDYGNYSEIQNMTTSEELIQKGDQITINTNANKFYYQGTLENKELPWDIAIKYYLDGKELSGSELAGKSGKLKITISVKQNNKVNDSFFNNYALQISLPLDTKLSSNIQADNATVAEAGGKKQLSYTVLPGNSMDIAVTADVSDFEMESITINGIKLSLGINVDNDQFTRQMKDLENAINELDDGAGELLQGVNQLADGMQKYTDGMKAFNDGLSQVSSGADSLNTGATSLRDGLSELTKQNDSLMNGALAIRQATFDSVNAELNEMGLGLPVLTPDNYSNILSQSPELASVKKQLDDTVMFTQGLQSYTDGVSQLEKGASELANGTSEFKSSASILAASANELYNAGTELNTGIKKLRDGLASYKNGTKELRHGTSGISLDIDDKIDELISGISGNGDEVISFVSEKNTNVNAVQFVLKTDSINLPEVQESIIEEPIELSFWQKLLKLFGLYKEGK